MACLHHYSTIQSVFTAIKLFEALLILPSLLPLVSMETGFLQFLQLFLEDHVAGIIQPVAFPDWLLLLNMNLGFFYIHSWFYSSFVFRTKYYPNV
jgi:hypothetical protein